MESEARHWHPRSGTKQQWGLIMVLPCQPSLELSTATPPGRIRRGGSSPEWAAIRDGDQQRMPSPNWRLGMSGFMFVDEEVFMLGVNYLHRDQRT